MNYTISVICCFMGLFMLYNTSRKAKLSTVGRFEKFLQANPVNARLAGLLLIIASFIMLAVKLGIGAGIFTSFLLLMLAAGLVVAIAPLQYLKLRHIIMLVVGSILLESLFL